MRGVAGDDSEKAQGWCNFCTGPQMVTAAENVARPLVVHLAARPDRAPGAAAGAPGTNLNAQAGEGEERLEGGARAARRRPGRRRRGGRCHRQRDLEPRGRSDRLRAVVDEPDVDSPLKNTAAKGWASGWSSAAPSSAGVGGYLMLFTRHAGRGRPRRRRGGREVLVERFCFALAIALRRPRVQSEVAQARLLPHDRRLHVRSTCNREVHVRRRRTMVPSTRARPATVATRATAATRRGPVPLHRQRPNAATAARRFARRTPACASSAW